MNHVMGAQWTRCAGPLALALVGGVVVAACGGAPPEHPKGPLSSATQLWIAPRNVVASLARDATIRRELTEIRLLEIVLPGQTAFPGIGATTAWSLKSLPAIRDALPTQGAAPPVEAIIYDNEAWPATPLSEAVSPVASEKEAARLIEGSGKLFVSTPGLDLVSLQHSLSGPNWQKFLQTGWIGASARLADILVIQAQSYEQDPAVYSKFVAAAVRQARRANPKILVIAGLTSTRGVTPALAASVVRCVTLTARLVNGYFLNVPQPSLAGLALQAAAKARAA